MAAQVFGQEVAGSGFAGAVHVRVHLTTHHESFTAAAILVVALFCVLQCDGCESRTSPGDRHDDNANHVEAPFTL